jgi:hypothetical protein
MQIDFLAYLAETLPDLCRVQDLVKIGLYRNPQSAYSARKKGDCPRFFRIPHTGIVYPKEEVIRFFKSLDLRKK